MTARDLREFGGWSVTEVAALVGRDIRQVYRWESQRCPPLYPVLLGWLLVHYHGRSLAGLALGLDSKGNVLPREVRRAVEAARKLAEEIKIQRKLLRHTWDGSKVGVEPEVMPMSHFRNKQSN